MSISRNDIKDAYQRIQSHICTEIERVDGKGQFRSDHWERDGGGGGHTRILNHGSVLEKAGVNFSAVEGKLESRLKKHLKTDAEEFFATGVSIVMHPYNPHVPIIHMNIRYFELDNGVYWFGGGIDLTPHYIVEEDAQYFHTSLKAVCDKYDASFYPKFKTWADDYFFIPHRNETRGVGGIFYDQLKENQGLSKEEIFDFSKDLGMLFPKVYSELIVRNRNRAFSDQEKEWQYVRRGRYVEFNLVYDRGTKFGLESNGRTESILMSLPEQAKWFYNYQVASGSQEQRTLDLLKKGINWA